MPLRKKVVRKPRRKVVRRTRVPRSPARANVPEHASCSSKITITPAVGGNYVTNTMYSQMNIQLIDYARPLMISKAYQFYRVKNVKITYKFPYDTYQQAVGGAAKPNFYYMLDKSSSINPAVTLEALKAMGARPRQVDEKPITVSWSPTVLTFEDSAIGPLASQYKVSPWLSTDSPQVNHLGVYWYVDQMFAGGTQYQAEIELQFEFKKPLWLGTSSATPAIGSRPAVLDNSPDGVVGGGDESNVVLPTH